MLVKLVLNECYGGLGVDEEYEEKFGCENCACCNCTTCKKLIHALENNEDCSAWYSKLRVCTIDTDIYTDYTILENDGYDTLLAVKDGKIVNL